MQQPDFWSRIRQGLLARVIVVYLGVSWVVLQVTGELQDALSLPAWVSPLAVVLLLIGLVIIMATAWVQSHPPAPGDGAAVPVAESTSPHALAAHLTWRRSITGGILAFSVLFGFAGLYVVVKDGGRSFAPSAATAGVAPALAVMPFTVTGEGLEVWREGMVDLMSTNLDGVGGLRTTDSRTVLARWRENVGDAATSDLQSVLQVARSAGARYALVGSAVAIGAGVRLVADLYDAESSAKLGSGRAEGPADSVLVLVDRLSIDVLKGILGGRASDMLSRTHRAAGLTTGSLSALKSYLEGEALYRRSDFQGAIAALERAVAEDTSFGLAYYRLSDTYGWVENISSERAEAAAQRALQLIERLPTREALVVRGAHALEHGELTGLEPLRQAVQQYPDDPDAWSLLGDTYIHLGSQALLDPTEGLEHFRRAVSLDPGFAPYYIHLLDAAVMSGDSAMAAQYFERYGRLAPHSEFYRGNRLLFELTFGNAQERARAAASLDTTPTSVLTAPSAISAEPRTLAARQQVLESLAPRSGVPQVYVTLLAGTLADRGKLAEAQRVLEQRMTPAARRMSAYLLHHQGASLTPELSAQLTVTPADTIALAILGSAAYAADRGRWGEVELARKLAAAGAERAAAADHAERTRMFRGVSRALDGLEAWRRGRPAEALPVLEAVQREAVGFGGLTVLNNLVRSWLAELHIETGRPQEALRYLDSLGSIDARYRRAQLYERLGRLDEARRDYAACLEAWADADEAFAKVAEARAALERLGTDRAH